MAYSGNPGSGETGGSLLPYRPAASIEGTSDADVLSGTGGGDAICGRGGGDTLRGRGGNDRLEGGVGRDVLIGGAGDDVFVFGAARHSANGAPDVIRGGGGAPAFEGAGRAGGDRIDLSGIDADPTRGGDQAFGFGGSGPGRVVLTDAGGHTLVQVNTAADAAFEFALLIQDGAVRASDYTAADFIL